MKTSTSISPTTVNHHSLMLPSYTQGLEIGPLKDCPPNSAASSTGSASRQPMKVVVEDATATTQLALVRNASSSNAADKPRVSHGFQSATAPPSTSCPTSSTPQLEEQVSLVGVRHHEAGTSGIATRVSESSLQTTDQVTTTAATTTSPLLQSVVERPSQVALETAAAAAMAEPQVVQEATSVTSSKNTTSRAPIEIVSAPAVGTQGQCTTGTTRTEEAPKPIPQPSPTSAFPAYPPPSYPQTAMAHPLQRQVHIMPRPPPSHYSTTLNHHAGPLQPLPTMPLDHKDHAAANKADTLDCPPLKKPALFQPSPNESTGGGTVCPTVRNQRMLPTDCLLFAASLLQDGEDDKAKADTVKPSSVTSMSKVNGKPKVAAQSRKRKAYSEAQQQQQYLVPVQPGPARQSGSIQPKENDVLCGRGGQVNKHIGNQVYRRVVEYNKPFYQTVQKRHRILVSQSIVQSIVNRGGRFLSEETQTRADGTTVTAWVEIDVRRAVQKTSQALRERPAKGSGKDESTCSANTAAVSPEAALSNQVSIKG